MKTNFYSRTSPCLKGWFRNVFVSSAIMTVIALLSQSARAADVTWSGGSGTGAAWLATSNWVGGTVPGSSDNAVFASINALASQLTADPTLLVNGTLQVGSITMLPNVTTPNFNLKDSSSTSNLVLVLNGVNGVLLSNASPASELILNTNGGANNQGMRMTLASSGIMYAGGQLLNYTADPGRIEIYCAIGETGGSRSITLTGPGNVYLRGASTFSGGIIVSNGAVEFETNGNMGTGPLVLSGGSVQCGSSRSGTSAAAPPLPNAIVVNTNAYMFNLASTAGSTRFMAWSGTLTGPGPLIICNPTTTTGNTFVPRFFGGFTNSTAIVIGDNTGDAMSDNAADFSAMEMGNFPSNGVQVWNGNISGPGSLRRISQSTSVGGTSILTGNNTYAGGTTISSGTLFANNTTGSALGTGNVLVTNLGTLAGNGTVTASVLVITNGTIQPGSTSSNIGKLTLSSLAMGPAAVYNWLISAATGTPGTAWDLITCTSGWTDTGSSGNPNVINISSQGLVPTGWNPSTTYTWLIISNATGSPGFNINNWALNSTAFAGTVAGIFSLAVDGNGSLDLVYTPAPNLVINVPSGSVTQGQVSPTPYPQLTGLNGVVKVGNGEVVLTNSLNSYAGSTYIFAGTATAAVDGLNGSGAFGAGSTAIVVGGTNGTTNATLNINTAGVSIARNIVVQSGSSGVKTIGTTIGSGTANYLGDVLLQDNVTLNAAAGGADLFGGNFSGTGGITFGGGGIYTMSGLGSYSGTTALNGGLLNLNGKALGTNTFTIGAPSSLDNTSAATITLNSTPMVWNADITFIGTTNLNVGPGAVTMGASRTVTVNSNVFTVGGPISGVGFSLTKAGPGELSLTSATPSTYTGGTTNLAGILGINDTATFGDGTGPLVMAGGVLRNTSSRGGSPIINPVQITTSSRISGDSTSTPPSTRILPFTGVFTVTPGSSVVVDNVGLASNTFVLQLQGSNYTTINWPIVLGDAGFDTPGSLTALNLFNDITAPVQTVNGLISGSGLVQRGASTLNTGGTTILTQQNTYTGGTQLYSGAIGFGASSTSAGGTVLSGPVGTGTLTLGNSNSETNLTVFASGGARVIDNRIVLNGDTNITFAGTNDLTLTGPFNSGGAAKTLNVVNTGITTISGSITNTGSSAGGALTKTGPGTLVFTGTNSTYPGTTTVSGGKLLVNNTSGSGTSTNIVTVNSGGTLGGTGIIAGNVTFASGAQAYLYKTNGSPDSPLTLSGTLTLNGNTVVVDLGGSAGLSTGTYTLINYAGALSGSFSSTPVIVNGSLASGKAGTIDLTTPNKVNLVVATSTVTPPTGINFANLVGNQFTLSGTNGTGNTSYRIVTSTNAALALTNWVPIATNNFAANGGFTNVITINTNERVRFYRVKTP